MESENKPLEKENQTLTTSICEGKNIEKAIENNSK